MKKLIAIVAALLLFLAPLNARWITAPEQAALAASFSTSSNTAYASASNAPNLLVAEYWFGVGDAFADCASVYIYPETTVAASIYASARDYSYSRAYNAADIDEQTYWVGRAAGYDQASGTANGW